MTWIFAATSVLFLILAVSLILGNKGGSPLQPGKSDSSEEEPIFFDKLLPASYDHEEGHRFEAKAASADQHDLEGAHQIFQQIPKDHKSAIVELNLAKLSLDKLERDRKRITDDAELNKTRDYIRVRIQSAKALIKDKPSRYPPDINDYVTELERRLGRLR